MLNFVHERDQACVKLLLIAQRSKPLSAGEDKPRIQLVSSRFNSIVNQKDVVSEKLKYMHGEGMIKIQNSATSQQTGSAAGETTLNCPLLRSFPETAEIQASRDWSSTGFGSYFGVNGDDKRESQPRSKGDWWSVGSYFGVNGD